MNEIIIQKVLNIPAMKNYFHPKLTSRDPYYMIDNEYVDKRAKFSICGNEVILIDTTFNANKNILKITRFKKASDKIKVSLYYQIENIEISAILEKGDEGIKVDEYTIIEF